MSLLNRFRRSTHSTHFIPEIDGLRFFAIATVMIFHLNTALVRSMGWDLRDWMDKMGTDTFLQGAWWIIRLDLGVKVFFAISGFILTLPFLKQYLAGGRKINIGDYLYRRLTRLEPPFVVSLVVFALIHVFLLNQSGANMLPHFLAGLIYSHGFIFGAPNPINPVTWSLETEAQFYLILPLLIALIFRFRSNLGRIVIVGFLFGISIYLRNYLTVNGVSQLSASILSYFSNFAVGGIFALLYLKRPHFFAQSKAFIFDILGVAAIFLLFYFYKPQIYWLNNLIFNASILALFIAVFRGKVFNWFYTRPIIYLIGGMCYTIYLLHYAFYYGLVPYTLPFSNPDTNYWWILLQQALIILPVFMLIASAFYLLIEKPCMDKNWPKKLIAFLKNTRPRQ